MCEEPEQKEGGKTESNGPEKYARLPESVLFDHRLSPTGRCVYGALARFVFQGTTVTKGQRQIAKHLGLHVGTVNAAIHELAERKHIAIIGTGRSRRTYHLRSSVFGKKQRAGVEEVISSPSRSPRFASVRTAGFRADLALSRPT